MIFSIKRRLKLTNLVEATLGKNYQNNILLSPFRMPGTSRVYILQFFCLIGHQQFFAHDAMPIIPQLHS